jgi:A/G-specific adenine glycosylase
MMKKKPFSSANQFSSLLLQWNQEKNTRKMPWKGEKDPYKIWLSEIILQQTRVEQGLTYYERFIQNFPDVHKLAKAPEEKVFKLWEGLGYYSRCRNLLATARYISKELKGKFPADYESIIALKGIGPYTAAAISSFAFNLPHAVVDGNVFRVLARVFGIDKPVDSADGKKYFAALADELLDKQHPGLYNQAIMDFGAAICKPAAPLCSICVFNKKCVAFKNQAASQLPVKGKKINVKRRWFYYLVMEYQNTVAIRKRNEKDIWQGLYEFPLIETAKEESIDFILKQIESPNAEKTGYNWLQKGKYAVMAVSPLYKQKLSHQLITGQFITLELKKKPVVCENWLWVNEKQLKRFAYPHFINQYFQQGPFCFRL